MTHELPTLRLPYHEGTEDDYRAWLSDVPMLVNASSMNATSTPFNFLKYPTDIVLLVVRLPAPVEVEFAGSG